MSYHDSPIARENSLAIGLDEQTDLPPSALGQEVEYSQHSCGAIERMREFTARMEAQGVSLQEVIHPLQTQMERANELTKPFARHAEFTEQVTAALRAQIQQARDVTRPLEEQGEELRRITAPSDEIGERLRAITHPTEDALGDSHAGLSEYEGVVPEAHRVDRPWALNPADFKSPVAETNEHLAEQNQYLADQNQHLREQAVQAQAAQKRQMRVMYLMVTISALGVLISAL